VLVENGIIGFSFYMTMLGAVFFAIRDLPVRERRFALATLATLVTAMLPLTWEDRRVVWFTMAALLGLAKAHGDGFVPFARRSLAFRAGTPGRSRIAARQGGAPVYNGEPYFDRAIPGILAQSFEDFEFILVDDGSSDNSLERLHEVARHDPRVRVFSPGRLGAAAAYNFAVAQAKAPYIARQDFDDRSYPDRLRLQVALLDAHTNVGVVGGSVVKVDEVRGERYVRRLPTEHAAILTAMARYIPIVHTLATFRRSAWEEAGGYPAVNNLIDMRFWLRIAKLGWSFANVPEVIGEHYAHPKSWFNSSFKYGERQRDLARVQAQIIRELDLPTWMYLFAFGRYAYAYIPSGLKRVVRRGMVGSPERDV
jgi:glycosyltransferase EpsE